MRSRDLVAASMDLLVNFRDFLIIFDPTNGICINSHLLLPINSTPWGGGGRLLVSCLFATWLAFSSLYLISYLFGEKPPTAGAHRARHILFFFREMMILRWSEA